MRRWIAVALVSMLVLALRPAGAAVDGAPGAGVPLVGFSFSPKVASWSHQAAEPSLARLLRILSPDLVRLPVYWDSVAPSAAGFDFSSVDGLLQVVADYDAAAKRHHTRVVLVIGARNLAYPELHVPDWAGAGGPVDLARLMRSRDYLQYFGSVVERYAANPLLYAWQVENEPLDSTDPEFGDVAEPAGALAAEIDLLRAADPTHQVVVTSFNSASVGLDRPRSSLLDRLWSVVPWAPQPAGHPSQALSLGDALGLDVYVVTPSTPLAQTPAWQRILWKEQTLDYWSGRAAGEGKQLWVTEMQGSPWMGKPGFATDDLIYSARAYAGRGERVVLLWGVEDWLTSPEWMHAGRRAFSLLRGNSG